MPFSIAQSAGSFVKPLGILFLTFNDFPAQYSTIHTYILCCIVEAYSAFLSVSRLAHTSCDYFFPFVCCLFNNSLFCLHIGLHTGYGLKKLQIRFFQIKKNFLMSVCLLFNLLPSYENFIQESLIMDSVKIGGF